MKTKKKCRWKLKSFFPKSGKEQKKGLFRNLIATVFSRKFAGSFSPGWLFFLLSSSAQLSMGGRLNLDGETRPPYNLSAAYNHILYYILF